MRFGQNQAHRLLKGGINRQIVTARLSLNNSPQTVTESREAPVVTSEKGISCHYFKLLFLRSIHARRGFRRGAGCRRLGRRGRSRSGGAAALRLGRGL